MWEKMCSDLGCVSPWSYLEGKNCQICKDKKLIEEAYKLEKQFNAGYDGIFD